MVKLKGQLMSLDGSGSIGKAITYSNWKGRPYAKKFKQPNNPNTAAQIGLRTMMRFLSQEWKQLNDNQQASWVERAAGYMISPFAAYTGANLARYAIDLYPAGSHPADLAGTCDRVTALAPDVYDNHVIINYTVPAPLDVWGVLIYGSQTWHAPWIPANVRGVQLVEALPTINHFRDVPSARGDWYYYVQPFNINGLGGLRSTVITAAY